MGAIRIGLDAMGGDFAPEAAVLGAIEASEAVSSESKIVLFGNEEQIKAILRRENFPQDKFDIVNTTEVIGMGDHPTHAFVKKSDSSIVVGFNHLKDGLIDGFASAGSTGAMMVGCMTIIKQVEGVIRPTISSVVPTTSGSEMVLLDVGLNVDCKPEILYQYGVIGSVFAKGVLKNKNPRVALLNIGEEKEKGNLLTKAAYELMEGNKKFNFVGNVEAKHIFDGSIADVIVCDGFVGNTIIKMAEAMYYVSIEAGMKSSYFDNFNYESVGGTPVLGINAPVIIGHGCSSPKAICNMILQTEKTFKGYISDKLKEIFS